MTEDKANAHAGMPSFGVSQFAVPVFQPGFGRMTKGNSPFGAWVVCVYQSEASLEPRLDRCNDTRLFCIHTKFGDVSCNTERTPEVSKKKEYAYEKRREKGKPCQKSRSNL